MPLSDADMVNPPASHGTLLPMQLMIEREKSTYKEAFSQLRELKSEIEHLQMLLEQSRGKLQKDFEQWMGVMLRQQMSATGATSVSAAASASPAASPMRGKAAASPGDAPDAYVSPGAPRKAWGDSRSETTSQSPSVRSSSSSLHPGAAPPAAAAIDLSKVTSSALHFCTPTPTTPHSRPIIKRRRTLARLV